MAQLEVVNFVKPINLTERAYSIVNSMWPRIETYIEHRGGVKAYLNKIKTGQPAFSDTVLQTALQKHFSQLLTPAGFFIKEFNLTYEVSNDTTYGAVNSLLMIKANGTAKIPLVIFDVCVCNVFDISDQDFLQTLFHELTHLEQSSSLLLEFSAEKLIENVPENKPLFIERLEQYFTSRNLDVVNDGEISSYARDLALKIFNRHKIELKNLPIEKRKQVVSQSIIPRYESYMSPGVKENIFDKLSNTSKGVFLRELVSQLYNFCDGLF